MKKVKFVFVVLLILGLFLSKLEAQNYFGNYSGEWSNEEGYVFTFKLHLEKDNSYFTWTSINPPSKPDTAKEFLKITAGTNNKTLILAGIRKDDPHNIIGIDEYSLKLSEDGKVLYGITKNHGDWKGRIYGIKFIN